MAPGSRETLYKRLGGYDAIAAVIDDFLGRAANDKQLSRFLVGLSTESKKRRANSSWTNSVKLRVVLASTRVAARRPHMQGWASQKATGS